MGATYRNWRNLSQLSASPRNRAQVRATDRNFRKFWNVCAVLILLNNNYWKRRQGYEYDIVFRLFPQSISSNFEHQKILNEKLNAIRPIITANGLTKNAISPNQTAPPRTLCSVSSWLSMPEFVSAKQQTQESADSTPRADRSRRTQLIRFKRTSTIQWRMNNLLNNQWH
jgi:hypothetical protein